MSNPTEQQSSSTEPSWCSADEAKGLWRVEIALRVQDLWHRLLEAHAAGRPRSAPARHRQESPT